MPCLPRKNREALVEVLFEELEKVVESGFEADEMQAGRRGFLQQLEVGRANDEQLAGQLANNRYLDRDIYHQARFEQAIEGLTLDELNAAGAPPLRPVPDQLCTGRRLRRRRVIPRPAPGMCAGAAAIW